MDRVSILLVDDHRLFREGLASILKDHVSLEVVGEAADGQDALEKAREFMPDVVLMDLRMPRCNGIEAARLIRSAAPHITIVMLTVSEKDEDLFEAMKAGAKGYIVKTTSAAELVSAIDFAAHGHVVIAPSMAGKLLAEFGGEREKENSPPPASTPTLTDRERQILAMVGNGLSNREIGDELCVSETTVKTHLRNILDKLHMRNRIQAAVYAAQQGFVRGATPRPKEGGD